VLTSTAPYVTWRLVLIHSNLTAARCKCYTFPKDLGLRREWIIKIKRDPGRHFKVRFMMCLVLQAGLRIGERVYGCVPIQGTHPSKGAFEGRLRHCDASRAVPFRRLLQMRPTNAAFFSRI
jgi:hypothetical protein